MAEKKNGMIYRNLGKTGLKVSIIGFGNGTSIEQKNIDRDFPTFKALVDAGVNFFDTAEMYADGESEIVLGKLLKKINKPREDFVISTKIFKIGSQVNSVGTSRKHIIEGALNSLKRLQLDYADIIFLHRFDHETPMEETVRAMNWLIENNKTFYWGTSEWSAAQIVEAHAVCDRLGLIKPVADQPQYNMLERQRFEVEYAELYDKFGMGTTVWSPLAMGLLTGKYNSGIPDDSRYGDSKNDWLRFMYDAHMSPDKKDKTVARLRAVEAIGKELGATMAQIALAWVLKNKDVSTAIIGASKIEQVESNLKAIEIMEKITPEIEARLSKALDNTPQTPVNFKTWAPFAPRR